MENENLALDAIKRSLVLNEEGILEYSFAQEVLFLILMSTEEELHECQQYMAEYREAKERARQ